MLNHRCDPFSPTPPPPPAVAIFEEVAVTGTSPCAQGGENGNLGFRFGYRDRHPTALTMAVGWA